MKKFLLFLSLCAFMVAGVTAQVPRGIYGTIQKNSSIVPAMYNHLNVASPSGIDTLKGVDTAYGQWTFANNYYPRVAIVVAAKTGTVTGTCKMQASVDGINWQNILADTSSCITCIGSTKVFTVTSGAPATYLFDFSNRLSDWSYWRTYTTGTTSSDTGLIQSYVYYNY